MISRFIREISGLFTSVTWWRDLLCGFPLRSLTLAGGTNEQCVGAFVYLFAYWFVDLFVYSLVYLFAWIQIAHQPFRLAQDPEDILPAEWILHQDSPGRI